MPARPRPPLLLALALVLLGAAPAAAGGLVQLDGAVLRFTADDVEPSNVTIDEVGGVLTLDDDASRMTAGAGCTASADGYHVECPGTGVERIEVRLGLLGSDVRIRADLPAHIQGGPGDDLLVGGPANDVIDGGGGQDIIAGGGGADVLSGGPGQDLVTYVDQIASDGTLLPRRSPIRAAIGRPGWSGAPGEGDTIKGDVEQLQGGAGNDTFWLRDGRSTEVACGAGHDTVVADPRDVIDTDCESARVAPQRGGARMTVPTLPFPFPGGGDRGRSAISVEPPLPLQRGAIVLRVSCPAGLGLLALVPSQPCSGRVRFTRFDGFAMGTRRVTIPRGGAVTVRLQLTSSRALARRASGLSVTATAAPDWGHVQRDLRFTVRG
ncbi:MAG TPA: calcium-binding protein [Conexibacter sp.]|nr:calcium-binding protein [Conexibacter sp.]